MTDFAELGGLQVRDIRTNSHFVVFKEDGRQETFIKKGGGLDDFTYCEDVEGRPCYIPSDMYVIL